jgi:hypothetical protein
MAASQKRDPEYEREAQEWIEAVTGVTFEAPFEESLKTGVLLCEYVAGAARRSGVGARRRAVERALGAQTDERHPAGGDQEHPQGLLGLQAAGA